MANSPVTFVSRGTRIFHGHAGSAITMCRLVQREATTGDVIVCASGARPCGVSPVTYADGDDADYHRGGIAAVETDGSAAVGQAIKAAADGSGKGILDGSPSYITAGTLLTLDTSTNIGLVELWF